MTQTPDTALSPEAGRSRAIRRTTLTAIVINTILTVGQISVGLFANAFSLVADAAHTLSDLVTDFLVLIAGQRGADPADHNHPYGHGRIETVTSLLLGASLVGVVVGFLWTSGIRLQNMGTQVPLHPAALIMAVLTLLAKEGLFRFTLAAGKRLKAPLLEANAWHARSDAASSLVVAIGIGGSLLGFRFLEPLAASVVGFLILSMGVRLGWRAVRELIDTGLSGEELVRLREIIASTPGVLGLHDLRTRRMANRVLCDAHIEVDPRITVSEGHFIAVDVELAVRAAYPEVAEVLVHVDIEANDNAVPKEGRLPRRDTVLADIRQLLGTDTVTVVVDHVEIHYLENQIEVGVVFLRGQGPQDIEALQQRTKAWLVNPPVYGRIRYWEEIAPK